MSKASKITFFIPPSPGSGDQRDDVITKLTSLGFVFNFWHYSDTNSGLGLWSYLGIGYNYVDGILTIATVLTSGVAHPASGSNIAAVADPGVGTVYTWNPVYAQPRISVSGDWGSVGSTPAQNNNLWVWNIPANSSAAATDFTNAINKIQSDTQLGSGYWNYYKYIDPVSGAWSVYAFAIFMGPLPQPVTYLVTCTGTPNPPTGSPLPSVSIPAFTQTFTTITAPLSFGPGR